MAYDFAMQSSARRARHPLAAACALLCASAALAQEPGRAAADAANVANAGDADTQLLAQAASGARTRAPALKEMVISASREVQDPDTLPMSIDVIDAGRMEREQASDIREMVNLLPNVEVPRAPARFSLAASSAGRDQNSGFNIRGLDGNRVLMLVDGVRLPRSYSFSANSFGRDYLDLGLVQRVEILRGSTPALY